MLLKRKIKKLVSLIIILSILTTSLSNFIVAQDVGYKKIEEETKVEDEVGFDFLGSAPSMEKDTLESLGLAGTSNRGTPSISNGVYAIAKHNTTSYMRCNTVSGGTYLSQQTFSSPPASESLRYAMFKIAYRSSTDDYVIRNMVNNEIVIYASASYSAPLSVRIQGASDNSIPSENAWKISETADGAYYIYCILNGVTYYMYMPSSGNLGLTNNKDLSGTKWDFNQYTGASFKGWGQYESWPEHIENGSSVTIEAYIYSTEIGQNRAWFNTSSVDPDVAQASRLSTSSKMTITPKYGGNTKIQIEANLGDDVFGYHYLMSGWDTGSFYIQNFRNSEYLTMMDGVSEAELRTTSLPNGEDKEYTLWNMVYHSNGYYKIIQDVVGDCIYGNNNTTYDLCGKPWADGAFQQTLWRFIPQSDGTVKIQSQYHEINNPNYYVSLANISNRNIRSLANTGDKQLWNIKPLKFNVSVLYDRAFINKHYSTGHMAVFNNVFGENSINNSIEKAMLEQLGVRFEFSYGSTTSNTFASYPYYKGCLECTDGDSFCENHYQGSSSYTCSTHGQSTYISDCTNRLHHKSWDVYDDNLPSSSSYIPILFTGHIGCGINDKTQLHDLANVSGYANYLAGTSIVILSQGDVASTGDHSARLLLHEITHIFNVPDNTQNYTSPEKPEYDVSQAYRMDCVMGYNRYESYIEQNLTICDYCKNIAKLQKYSFYNH